jgi:hypothetical protein
MRQLSRIAAASAAAGLALTACGGSSNVLQGKSPQQIVTLASTSIDQNSYHMALHATLSVDASGVQGVPQQEQAAIGSMLKNVTIDGSGDVQSAQRMRFSLTMKPILDRTIEVVLYDGGAYVSQDGGKSFADAGSFDFSGLPVSPSDLSSILKDLGTPQDQGSQTKDGQTVEKLHASIGQDFVNKVLGQMNGGAQAQQFAQLFAQVMSVRSGGVDLYVRHSDGRLDAENTDATIAIDMGKLMAALAQAFGGRLPVDASGVSGSMVLTEAANATFSDYGEKVGISKPTVDPNAPGLPSGAGGLFGA